MSIPALDSREVFELAAVTNLQIRLARLVLVASRCVDEKMKVAIGGAVAGRAAGWERNTKDLDLFARPVSARRLVKKLGAAGMKTFWINDAHGVAYLDEDNTKDLAQNEAPTVRIDVRATVTEPEATAIRTAIDATALRVPLKVFRADHLAAIKFLAGRPLDLADFDELILRGANVESVRYIVSIADEALVAKLMARIRKLQKPEPKGVAERPSRYLSREGFARAWRAAYEEAEKSAGR